MPDDTTRRRRILFRATHRGTYENDILIGGFVRARLDAFTDVELDALEAVMDLPDVILADWLTGRQPIPPEADIPMLRAMRQAALNGQALPPTLLPLPPGEGRGEGPAAGPRLSTPSAPSPQPSPERRGSAR